MNLNFNLANIEFIIKLCINNHKLDVKQFKIHKYLSIPSTSVTSERMFSKAGFLVSKRRSLLSPKSINEDVLISP